MQERYAGTEGKHIKEDDEVEATFFSYVEPLSLKGISRQEVRKQMQEVISLDDNIYKRAMVYKGEQFPDNDDLLGALITAVTNGAPLPKGHGDLIDRKNLIENGINKGFCDWYDEIKMAHTIIEADRSEDKE